MMNVQSTNYNPTFNAKVVMTPNAQRFFARNPYVAKDEIIKQASSLKYGGSKNVEYFIDVCRDALDNFAPKISVEAFLNADNKAVRRGVDEVTLCRNNDKFNLIDMAKRAFNSAGENQTYPVDMFKF